MPIDNEYFKNQQKKYEDKESSNNGGGGNFEPLFEPPEFFKKLGNKAWIIYLVVAILVVFFFMRPFVVINSGEVGIKVTTGKFEPIPLVPGFHIYVPVVQRIIVVDTKVRLIDYKRVESMSGTPDDGIKVNPAISILDARGLPVSIELTVQYKLLPFGAPNTIATWGLSWEDKIINPVVRDVVRNVVGTYKAEDLPTKRNEIAIAIEDGLRALIDKLPSKPVEFVSLQLREIGLPTKIKEQIERVQIANQESERVKYEVLRARQEAEKIAALAKGKADANRIEAQGRADAVTIEADAQSKANKLISVSLTPKLLQLEQIRIQGLFNDALRENRDAKIFLTPGGSTPNIWVDLKQNGQKQKQSSGQ